ACRGTESTAPPSEAAAVITGSQAQTIALADLGLDAAQVQGLHAVYAFDNGIPYYHVRFACDGVQYDVTLHAESGEILSVARR
ncbi:MAG: PepSY domain-containing protein, partial [Clostridia bacterium]|nr:PepSY domain-containing protein [Clostridia bacterium]